MASGSSSFAPRQKKYYILDTITKRRLVVVYYSVSEVRKVAGALQGKKRDHVRYIPINERGQPLRMHGEKRDQPFPRKTRHPVNNVVNDPQKLAQIIEIGNRLAKEYADRRAAAGHRKLVFPKIDAWFVVNQSCSRAYYHVAGVGRVITIATWAWNKYKPGYLEYIIAHEMAHHFAHALEGCTGHGEAFQIWLKRLCPPQWVHYELAYKPRAAKAAGIRKPVLTQYEEREME